MPRHTPEERRKRGSIAAAEEANERLGARSPRNRGASRVQPETTSERRSNPVGRTTPPTNPAQKGPGRYVGTMAQGEPAGQPNFNNRKGLPDSTLNFDVEGSQVIASAPPDSNLSLGQGVRNLRNRDTGAGGTVSTIPRESFVNPAFTGINSGENIARAVRRDFRRDQRDAEIQSDREFQERVQEQRLRDDANLRLTGDMSLTELADAASRRRSARRTLRQREQLASDQSVAQQQAVADRQIAEMEESGRNARKQAEIMGGDAEQQRERSIELADRMLKNKSMVPVRDENGQVTGHIEDPELRATGEAIISARGNMPEDLTSFELDQHMNAAKAIRNLEEASGLSISSLDELQSVMGFTDRELFEGFGDDAEIHLIDSDGKTFRKVALNDVLKGDPDVRRIVREAQKANVRAGRIQFAERSPMAAAFGQRPDIEFNLANVDDPQRTLNERRAREQRQEEREQRSRRGLSERGPLDQIQNLR